MWAFIAMLRGIWRDASEKPERLVSPTLDSTRQAVRIALLSIMFRALLDAKPWDWSIYFLGVVAIVTGCMQRHLEKQAESSTPTPTPAPGAPRRPAVGLPRPGPSGRPAPRGTRQ
jgi:hypothetical protein